MSKVFFLTECDPDLSSGGAIIRRGTIENLRAKGVNVIVVKPGSAYETHDGTYTIPGLTNSKFYYALEALGFVADKYFKWSNNVVSYMKDKIASDDIIFATTGGALSAVIAGATLREITGVKLIVNYHDPTDFTWLGNGFSRKAKFYHINRDRFEKKLISKMDYIVTSSESYKNVLTKKYPSIKDHIECNYFGYIKDSAYVKSISSKKSNVLNIVYGGNMGPSQSPEILAEAVDGLSGVVATFIGNYASNTNLIKYKNNPNIRLIDALSMDEYFKFLYEKADMGFFSLRNNLTNFCVPSKFFDYINIGLPMLAVVGGDARDLIIQKGYGVVSRDSVLELRKQIIEVRDHNNLNLYQENVLRDRSMWSMKYRINQLIDIISTVKNG